MIQTGLDYIDLAELTGILVKQTGKDVGICARQDPAGVEISVPSKSGVTDQQLQSALDSYVPPKTPPKPPEPLKKRVATLESQVADLQKAVAALQGSA